MQLGGREGRREEAVGVGAFPEGHEASQACLLDRKEEGGIGASDVEHSFRIREEHELKSDERRNRRSVGSLSFSQIFVPHTISKTQTSKRERSQTNEKKLGRDSGPQRRERTRELASSFDSPSSLPPSIRKHDLAWRRKREREKRRKHSKDNGSQTEDLEPISDDTTKDESARA